MPSDIIGFYVTNLALIKHRLRCPSGKPIAYHLAGDTGKAHVQTLMAVGQSLVVQAEAMEHGGVQVIGVDGIFFDGPSDIISATVDLAALEAAAGQESGKAEGVMVAAGVHLVAPSVFA